LLEDPDILKITMHLKTQSKDETYTRNKIPIFTEDEEARFLLREIFSFWIQKNAKFAIVENYFHLVECSIGADNLKTIFSDPHLMETSLKSICVLDGDHGPDLRKGIISLPGSKSPEDLIFEHCEKIFNDDDASFWENTDIIDNGFTKDYYIVAIQPKIKSIEQKLQQKRDNGESTAGLKRALNKSVFNSHIDFFKMITRNWLRKDDNKESLKYFHNGFQQLFFRVCSTNGINRKIWDYPYDSSVED
ncbi:TPA: AAA family ATPase, partial [Klebsiella pneumoniae]|nr:AAA family ATPase [Klebsiella pneumoniae]